MPYTIISDDLTKGWNRLPRNVKREYAIINKGDNPPGLYEVIITNGIPSGFFLLNSNVGISANIPDIGKHFVSWSGDISTVEDITASQTNIEVISDLKLEPIYENTIYTTVVNDGSGDGNYIYLEEFAIEADPPILDTMTFAEWVGDAAGIVDVYLSSTTMIQPPNNVTITATYRDIIYTLYVESGTPSGDYVKKTVVTISAAIPPSGKRFSHWSGDTDTIDVLHYSTTTIEMLADYNITAIYEDIPVLDPDADNLYYDTQDKGYILSMFDNTELANTPPVAGLDRVWDVAETNGARVLLPYAYVLDGGEHASSGGPGGEILQDTTDIWPEYPVFSLVYDYYAEDLIVLDRIPGGGISGDVGSLFLEWPELSLIVEVGDLEPPPSDLVYSSPGVYEDITNTATDISQVNFTGGSVDLLHLTDGDLDNDGIYTADDTDAALGLEYPTDITVSIISFYSRDRGDRVKGFYIERYDTGTSTYIKVPITTVSMGVIIVNTDEAEAPDVNEWVSVSIDTTNSSSIYRIRVTSGYNELSSQCGISEIKMYQLK